MQTEERAIKIIKREDRDAVDEKLELPLKTENEIKREILNTITSWVEQRRESNKELQRESGRAWTQSVTSAVADG